MQKLAAATCVFDINYTEFEQLPTNFVVGAQLISF